MFKSSNNLQGELAQALAQPTSSEGYLPNIRGILLNKEKTRQSDANKTAEVILQWKETFEADNQDIFLQVWAYFIVSLFGNESATTAAIRYVSAYPDVLNELIELDAGNAKRNIVMIACEDAEHCDVHYDLFDCMINHPSFDPHGRDSEGKKLLVYCDQLDDRKKELVNSRYETEELQALGDLFYNECRHILQRPANGTSVYDDRPLFKPYIELLLLPVRSIQSDSARKQKSVSVVTEHIKELYIPSLDKVKFLRDELLKLKDKYFAMTGVFSRSRWSAYIDGQQQEVSHSWFLVEVALANKIISMIGKMDTQNQWEAFKTELNSDDFRFLRGPKNHTFGVVEAQKGAPSQYFNPVNDALNSKIAALNPSEGEGPEGYELRKNPF